jgi:hypothetical protein
LKLFGQAALAILLMCILLACDPYRDTRPITVVAKPPLIEHQSCLALHDAEREPQDSAVMVGTAVHGNPDVFRVTCEGEVHELQFVLAPPPDDLGMKDLRKQWSKKTGTKDPECSRCPKYDLTAKFVGMLKTNESGKLIYVAQTADGIRRKRVRYGMKESR